MMIATSNIKPDLHEQIVSRCVYDETAVGSEYNLTSMPKDMALKEHFAALVESFYTRVLNKDTPLTPLADQKRTPLLAVSWRPQ